MHSNTQQHTQHSVYCSSQPDTNECKQQGVQSWTRPSRHAHLPGDASSLKPQQAAFDHTSTYTPNLGLKSSLYHLYGKMIITWSACDNRATLTCKTHTQVTLQLWILYNSWTTDVIACFSNNWHAMITWYSHAWHPHIHVLTNSFESLTIGEPQTGLHVLSENALVCSSRDTI